MARHRRITAPEVLHESSDEEEKDDLREEKMEIEDQVTGHRVKVEMESSDDDDEELDEEAIERRRQRLRVIARQKEEVNAFFALESKFIASLFSF